MADLYQFKAALNEHSYQSETYSYIIMTSEWSYIDLDVLNFGHLIDLVERYQKLKFIQSIINSTVEKYL